jgi:hypothetical protein
MKTTLITSLSALALACSLLAQTPSISPDVTASASASVAPTTPPVAPAAPTAPPASAIAPSATPTLEEDLESRIEQKAKRGINITFGDDDKKTRRERRARDRNEDRIHVRGSDFDDGALMAIPIVGIIFTTLFGAPVLIVGLIMFFSYWKARSLHRTVRMMVEKGQPVPEALFATPPRAIRQRSDMRRGVILTMLGIGVMIFFGAMDDWDGGAWALGIIPFLIGCGYLLVWKLEDIKASTDNPSSLS